MQGLVESTTKGWSVCNGLNMCNLYWDHLHIVYESTQWWAQTIKIMEGMWGVKLKCILYEYIQMSICKFMCNWHISYDMQTQYVYMLYQFVKTHNIKFNKNYVHTLDSPLDYAKLHFKINEIFDYLLLSQTHKQIQCVFMYNNDHPFINTQLYDHGTCRSYVFSMPWQSIYPTLSLAKSYSKWVWNGNHRCVTDVMYFSPTCVSWRR